MGTCGDNTMYEGMLNEVVERVRRNMVGREFMD